MFIYFISSCARVDYCVFLLDKNSSLKKPNDCKRRKGHDRDARVVVVLAKDSAFLIVLQGLLYLYMLKLCG